MESREPRDADRPSGGEIVPASARRVLDRPPSDRYRDRDGGRVPVAMGSAARSVAGAVVAATLGAGLLVLLAAPLAVAEPLVAVAVALGLATGYAARIGGGTVVAHRRRRVIAVCAAIAAVAGGELIVWQIAISEGGVLSFVDYQLQVFGPISFLEPLAAGVAAWATA